ncbi:MAG: response regulator transcription factor [Verrucomicrobia bacterium]|nr:response regulator transcription factor [Verrucomicrobiota bacterium]
MKKETSLLRVLIADDFEPVRRRLAQLLADVPGVEIVGQSNSVRATLDAIHSLAPDVVTLDLNLLDGSGLEVLRRTRGEQPRPVFIVLTNFPFDAYHQEATRLEAHAFLDKSREIEKAIELIHGLAQKTAQPEQTGEQEK